MAESMSHIVPALGVIQPPSSQSSIAFSTNDPLTLITPLTTEHQLKLLLILLNAPRA